MAKRPDYKKWYDRVQWHNLRTIVLARDPVCMDCKRYPSTIADHVTPHRGSWTLFCDLKNLQGLCRQCHNRKTAAEDGGFGNAQQRPKPTTTFGGLTGSVSAVGSKAIDAALDTLDVDALLAGL